MNKAKKVVDFKPRTKCVIFERGIFIERRKKQTYALGCPE